MHSGKMNITALFTVFSCLCLLSVHGHFFGGITSSLTDTPCTPNFPRHCGDYELLSEASTPLTESDGFGPNVCRVTKTYQVGTLAYVEANICNRRGQCRTYCAATQNCTGPLTNVTASKTDCCDGFAVDPEDQTAEAGSHRWRRTHSRRRTLMESGCTLMLRESVVDCLLELNLDAFTLQLLAEDPDVADDLVNGDSAASYTVFGLSDDDVDPSASTLGHVVNRIVQGKKLRHGTVLKTLAANVSIHIGKTEDKSVFANGVEVTELNACQARNGIVHIVESVIPQPSITIADTLQQDPRFSTFLRLLDGASITPHLDVAQGKSRTLLAPTNDAFDDLPEGAVECLLLEENSNLLSQLVLIHISSPAEYSATLSQRSRLFTFNRRYYLLVAVEEGDILLTSDEISLEESDIPANNGVIHVLPQVIVPPEVDFDTLSCDSGPQIVGA